MGSIRSNLVSVVVGSALVLSATGTLAQDGAATIVVAQDGSGDFSTISEAVAAATEGDTVVVRSGMYDESVSVDKNLSIKGDGERESVVVEPTTGQASFTLTGSDATLTGLTLRGEHATVILNGGSPTLEDLFFDSVGIPFNGNSWVDAVSVQAGSRAIIRGSTFVDWGGLGVYSGAGPRFEGNEVTGGSNIFISYEAGAAAIVGNTIRGQRVRGMWVGSSATTLIEGNTIIDPAQEGIVFAGVEPTDLVVRGNRISGGSVGISVVDAGGPTLEGNDISGTRTAAIQVNAQGEPRIVGNAIHDNDRGGIILVQGAASLADNSILGNQVGLVLSASSTPVLSGNTICDNATNVRYLGEGEMPDLTGNDVCADAQAMATP